MARYFFDLHADGPAQWDHSGSDVTDEAGIEARARAMLADAILERDAQGDGNATITVFVHEGSGGVVLTALAKPDAEVELVWA